MNHKNTENTPPTDRQNHSSDSSELKSEVTAKKISFRPWEFVSQISVTRLHLSEAPRLNISIFSFFSKKKAFFSFFWDFFSNFFQNLSVLPTKIDNMRLYFHQDSSRVQRGQAPLNFYLNMFLKIILFLKKNCQFFKE